MMKEISPKTKCWRRGKGGFAAGVEGEGSNLAQDAEKILSLCHELGKGTEGGSSLGLLLTSIEWAGGR